jgi:hypothetical protein
VPCLLQMHGVPRALVNGMHGSICSHLHHPHQALLNTRLPPPPPQVCTGKMNLSDEVDLEDYVSRPDKISAAEISAICQEAGMHAVRKNRCDAQHSSAGLSGNPCARSACVLAAYVRQCRLAAWCLVVALYGGTALLALLLRCWWGAVNVHAC